MKFAIMHGCIPVIVQVRIRCCPVPILFEYTSGQLAYEATRVADIWIVWLQDGIRVEFEEQLPLREYALRIPL